MGLFKRKGKVELVPCPQCGQLIPRDALECDMCGLDLRESPPRRGSVSTSGTSPDR